MALCPDCHLVKHFGRAMAEGRTRYALAWFAQVNALSPDVALANARQALDEHARRSRLDWSLDLSLLVRRYGVRLDSRQHEML